MLLLSIVSEQKISVEIFSRDPNGEDVLILILKKTEKKTISVEIFPRDPYGNAYFYAFAIFTFWGGYLGGWGGGGGGYVSALYI